MYNKINIKYLVIAFVGLLALALITITTGSQKKNSSFKSELISFDTASVTGFTIFPKAGGNLISFSKKDNNWLISDNEEEYSADNNQVKNMLLTISNLRATRLAAKDKDSWKKYELTDSLGTRIEVLNNKKVLADVYIGKFTYSQPAQSANPYQRSPGVMTSFVRLSDEKEVYAVDGFLNMTFNRQLKDYRDNKVLQLQKDKLEQVVFMNRNQSFTLIKNDSTWMIDGLIADSTKVAEYLSEVSNIRSSGFISNEKKPVGNPEYTLKFAGNNGTELAVVSGFYSDSTNIAIGSSMNAGAYFDGTEADLFEKLFKEKSDFLSQ